MFERVAVVGTGLIGASLAMAVRRRWPSSLVIGVDRKDVIERAMVAHIIDVGADDLGMVGDADLIVLAASVRTNAHILRERLASLVTRKVFVTDVGSTKRVMADAARGLPEHIVFIGGHPIAGAAAGGLEHARHDLFQRRPWIVCPSGNDDASALRDFVTAVGAVPVEMTPERHDHLVAFLSHLPQFTASALMKVVADGIGIEGLKLAGRGLEDTTRLASSPPGIWKDVASTNSDEIAVALDALIDVLQKLRDDLENGEDLEDIFRSAQEWKVRLEQR